MRAPLTESTDPTTVLPCWLEVDLDAIAANVAALRRWVRPNTHLAAVVKAQAYGVGAQEVARTALAAGAAWLAVDRVHEGAELRRAAIAAPILLLGRTDPSEADAAVEHDLTVTVDTADLARGLGKAAQRHRRRVPVHVKVDTGMHRSGLEPEGALPLVREIARVPGLDLQGLYTHFANADEPDPSFTMEQVRRFERVRDELAAAGFRFSILHAANSAATLASMDVHLDMVRLGLSLYGVSPSGSVPADLDLQPAVALKARIGRIMDLAPGDGVGYGQTWRAERPTRVALALAGYADGVLRALSNRGGSLVRGQDASIIGRVSMAQTTLDITDIEGVGVGSVATFFGKDGAAQIDLHRVAREAGTIPHDVLTAVGARVARVYRRGGQVSRVARLSGTFDVGLAPSP